MAWPSTPDEPGKQMDGRFGLRVDVFLMFHDQMFLSQVESCVSQICDDVVAGIVESKEHPRGGFARISYVPDTAFPRGRSDEQTVAMMGKRFFFHDAMFQSIIGSSQE